MDALLMAGGKAVRMNGVEKPVVLLCGRPLIEYVIDALLASRRIGRVFVALTEKSRETRQFLAAHYAGEGRLTMALTPGEGYVEDTAYAVRDLGLSRPVLVISADVPLVTPGVLDRIVEEYEAGDAEALSVRVERSAIPLEIRPDTVLNDWDIETVPAAINVLDGRYIDRYQRERLLILKDARLAYNVNNAADLAACERIVDSQGVER